MTTENKNLNYGSKDFLDERHLEKKNHKHKITMWLDGDVLEEIKTQAEQIGAGYQNLIQKILRDHLQKPTLEKRLELIEKKLKKIG